MNLLVSIAENLLCRIHKETGLKQRLRKGEPMARYIEEKFIRAAMFHPLPYTHITPPDVDVESFKRGWNDALEAVLENSETADVRENVHGNWIGIDDEPCETFECDRCGFVLDDWIQGAFYNFCPNCGADMRG